MIYGPPELNALCGGPVPPPVLRAALRHNARIKDAASTGETPAPRTQDIDPFYLADKARLKALEGRRCPLCRFGSVSFDGLVLRCGADHTWSSVSAAEDEIR